MVSALLLGLLHTRAAGTLTQDGVIFMSVAGVAIHTLATGLCC